LDSLTGRDSLKICTHYNFRDKLIDSFPINPILEEAKPVYIELPGWDKDISKIRRFKDLPQNAQSYVLEIEKKIECPIKYISVGPEREAIIIR